MERCTVPVCEAPYAEMEFDFISADEFEQAHRHAQTHGWSQFWFNNVLVDTAYAGGVVTYLKLRLTSGG